MGTPVDWTPARTPGDEPLVGDRVRLEPLDPARHGDGLWAASNAGDATLYDYLPYGPFPERAGFDAFLAASARAHEHADDRFYAIVRAEDDAPAGVLSYSRIAPADGRIEIANIWFGAALQRTPAATEVIFLMARHAFDVLGNRRLEWKCNALNARSRRAAERYGFTFEGIFRQDRVLKGRNRDTAWFSLLDGEWPAARAAFEAWLAPGNFDAEGRQRRGLAELREAG
ncbi:GNAT family N-acetyltransferase [Patulibacter sp. S7RM1-6]